MMGVWRSSGDVESIWDKTISCIKEAAREVLGVSKGNFGGRQGAG